MLDKPLKEVGEHEVEVKVQDKSAKFKVNIVAA
jgi:ribosomal protein L9